MFKDNDMSCHFVWPTEANGFLLGPFEDVSACARHFCLSQHRHLTHGLKICTANIQGAFEVVFYCELNTFGCHNP